MFKISLAICCSKAIASCTALLLMVSCNSFEEQVFVNDPINYDDTSVWLSNVDSVSNRTVLIGKDSCKLEEHTVFYQQGNLRPVFRIPSLCITKDVVLLSCENRNLIADEGDMDVLVAYSNFNSNKWDIRKVFENDSVKGHPMNPIFVVDKKGTHGKSNRVYLFALRDNKTTIF